MHFIQIINRKMILSIEVNLRQGLVWRFTHWMVAPLNLDDADSMVRAWYAYVGSVLAYALMRWCNIAYCNGGLICQDLFVMLSRTSPDDHHQPLLDWHRAWRVVG